VKKETWKKHKASYEETKRNWVNKIEAIILYYAGDLDATIGNQHVTKIAGTFGENMINKMYKT
jgi:hypothetical protein